MSAVVIALVGIVLMGIGGVREVRKPVRKRKLHGLQLLGIGLVTYALIGPDLLAPDVFWALTLKAFWFSVGFFALGVVYLVVSFFKATNRKSLAQGGLAALAFGLMWYPFW